MEILNFAWKNKLFNLWKIELAAHGKLNQSKMKRIRNWTGKIEQIRGKIKLNHLIENWTWKIEPWNKCCWKIEPKLNLNWTAYCGKLNHWNWTVKKKLNYRMENWTRIELWKIELGKWMILISSKPSENRRWARTSDTGKHNFRIA